MEGFFRLVVINNNRIGNEGICILYSACRKYTDRHAERTIGMSAITIIIMVMKADRKDGD